MPYDPSKSRRADDAFNLRGHLKVQDFLSPEMTRLIRHYMDLSLRSGRMEISANEVIRGQFEQYGAMLSESLLSLLQPRIESVVGEPLIPTYSFWRIYQRGAMLRQHVDRAACEISVSISIAVEPKDVQWPLWVRGIDNRARAIRLSTGEALVYRGVEVPHWRDSFAGDVQYQMLLHYILRDGANGQWAYDGRAACALSPTHRTFNNATGEPR
ncbi:hypothetical protein R69658_07917 [Paraburkholderia aspalathi]|uniref:Uncharacterized protein n=1 Tax=Paraburkholderia aspalathi TaxID=1324617 RepID=A0ABM8T846_9BURK|nr:hypothetical protein R69658_07917 [Paraburkholderia aspalathi]